ncbi:type III secretion system export apparatus subunit SctT [Aestuariibius sp. 2305UL40-4]|uniref:type III secretion system export apparatus subunit SctT n=1 Tax=Aestuariibius violaceus TaxID=3234132 RepID=UPI00345E56C7
MDIPALIDLSDLFYALLKECVVGSARMIGLMTIFPVFRRVQMGQLIKSGIAVGVALPMVGGLSEEIAALDLSATLYPFLVAKEVAVGALFGLVLGIPFWAAQAVGEIIDTQRDIAAGGLDDPSTGSQASVMAAFLGFTAIAIFVTSGGLQQMLAVHYGSYAFWPLATFWPSPEPGAWAIVIEVLQAVMFTALLTATPVVALFLLSDLSVMAMSKLAPQMAPHVLAPLLKNILFTVFIVAYSQFLLGYILETIPPHRIWEEELRLLAPE